MSIKKLSKETEFPALNKNVAMRMASKYYFRTENDERCYTLEYHLLDAKDKGLTEIKLFEAVPEKIDGMFWCRAVNECGEEGYCGSQCAEYEPKNGKSGMCKYKCSTFHNHGKKVVFKVK